MLPEQSEKMLREYKMCVGRYKYLCSAIAEAEKDLAYWRARLAEDLVSGGVSVLDGMPHGTDVGNPTECVALKLAMGYVPQHITEAETRLSELREEKRQKEMVVVFVDAWLDGLTEKERWIVEQIYFEGSTYNDTARAYTERYSTPISRDGIRRLKKAAADRIAEMAR